MKRTLIYAVLVGMVLVAVYIAATKVSQFATADETAITPEEAVEVVVEQPTQPPPPTDVPPPTMVPPTVAPPPTMPPPPTMVPPTVAPPPTIAPTVEPPTAIPPTEVVAPTVAEVLPTEAFTPTTEVLSADVAPTTEVLALTDVPTVDPASIPTVEVSPTIVRGENLGSTPVPLGGQSSVEVPAALPPTTEPGSMPTATIVEFQATVIPTSELPAMAPPVALPTVLPTTELSPEAVVTPVLAQITGVVNMTIAVNLVLTLPDGTTLNGTTASDGSFVFPDLLPGAYHLEASATGFLTSEIDFSLTDGQNFTLPTAVLTPGDTNGDNVIDVSDAVVIAANFGGPPVADASDLNGDGWIDIQDLAIIGSVFGESGPVPWG